MYSFTSANNILRVVLDAATVVAVWLQSIQGSFLLPVCSLSRCQRKIHFKAQFCSLNSSESQAVRLCVNYTLKTRSILEP